MEYPVPCCAGYTTPPTVGYSGRGRGRGRGDAPFGGGGRGRGGGQDRGRGGGQDRGAPRGGFGGGGRGRGGPPSGPVIYREGVAAQVPAALSDASLQALVTSFKSLQVGPEKPLRPGFGTLGTPITLRCNFFAIKRTKTGPTYDYVVEIKPTTDLKRIKKRIFHLLERQPQFQPYMLHIAHDESQRLVSSKKLPQPLTIGVPFYEDNEDGPSPNADVYAVSFTLDRELNMDDLDRYKNGDPTMRQFDTQPLVSALNLILQQQAKRSGGVRVGDNRFFFPTQSQAHHLGPGIQALQGFYASTRIVQKQLVVNVNACMTAFLTPGNLADRMLEFNRGSSGAMPTLPQSMVNALKVKTTHLGYRKKLQAVGTESPRNFFFDCAEFGGKTSVEQYFLKKYKIKLKYPTNLPVVDIGSKKRSNWIPPELCVIEVGTPYFEKLSDQETASMIKVACNPPRMNAEAIVTRGLPLLGLTGPNSVLNGFGLSVEPDMTVAPGRELPPPRLSYKVGRANVANASWNILDVKFHQGASVSSWWVLPIWDSRDGRHMIQGSQDARLLGLMEGFKQKMKKSGIALAKEQPILVPPVNLPHIGQDPGRKRAIRMIGDRIQEGIQKNGKPGFILVLLENRDSYIYPAIKKFGDVELGVHTIHMQLGKAFNDDPKKQDQYFSNVALKVNTKLGGMNHLLDAPAMVWLKKKKTMMVGIDVTHPGPGSREGTPSIAAVVASVDDNFVQFPASMAIQPTKQEMLDEGLLTQMFVERLLVYEKKSKGLPERILVYRDGVSEGQFDTVLSEELPQILKAFKKLETPSRKSYRPTLSIIICGKRHHARPYATDSQFADRNGNTRPGTVVDRGITGVFDFDFYLQAHAGLQGNVKSTHYTVIYDENSLTADEIQQGTHTASYLYARATKAVSLIPAAYYADLACERGRCYLNDFLTGSHQKLSGSRADKEQEKKLVFEAAEKAWGNGLHPDIQPTMFYI